MKFNSTVLILALAASPLAGAQTIAPAAADVVAAAAVLAPDNLSATERAAVVGPDTKGANVLRAQVLLARAHFSSGEIDAAYGSNLRQAITGFQKARGLPTSAVVDAATWAELEKDKTPVLQSYTVTEADAAGPYQPVPTEMADKAKLKMLGYADAAEALGEQFHASPTLLRQLNPGKRFDRAGEQLTVPRLDAAAELPKAAQIVVDNSDRTLSLLDEAGKVIAQFPASTGSEHDPLPVGNWKVNGVAKLPVYNYNPKLFWDAKPGEGKARIAAGPNNPVGLVWIDLSKDHYGIHGTPEPQTIGKTQSHGCIRLTNWDASAVARAVGPGVPVILQE